TRRFKVGPHELLCGLDILPLPRPTTRADATVSPLLEMDLNCLSKGQDCEGLDLSVDWLRRDSQKFGSFSNNEKRRRQSAFLKLLRNSACKHKFGAHSTLR